LGKSAVPRYKGREGKNGAGGVEMRGGLLSRQEAGGETEIKEVIFF